MDVSIIGLGYVGCVTAACMAQIGHRVIGVDLNPLKVGLVNEGLATVSEPGLHDIVRAQVAAGRIRATCDIERAVLESDVSIIAVGTPGLGQGYLDMSQVHRVTREIGYALRRKPHDHVVVIRSTVMPGTTIHCTEIIAECSGSPAGQQFHVTCNPEFLREGTAVSDYADPPFLLIGAQSESAARTTQTLFGNSESETIVTEPAVAELVKLVSNTFHALKVSFANEIAGICEAVDVSPWEVMGIFSRDTVSNISNRYLTPGYAFGGSCLPKDLQALYTLASGLGIQTPVIGSISRSNKARIDKAVDDILGRRPGRVGIVGLAFKAGTDDLRNSPAIVLASRLLDHDVAVELYDRNLDLSRLMGTNKDYALMHLPQLPMLICADLDRLVQRCDLIVITTAGTESAAKLQGLRDTEVIDLTGTLASFRNKVNR